MYDEAVNVVSIVTVIVIFNVIVIFIHDCGSVLYFLHCLHCVC